jgi:hypothetical protein
MREQEKKRIGEEKKGDRDEGVEEKGTNIVRKEHKKECKDKDELAKAADASLGHAHKIDIPSSSCSPPNLPPLSLSPSHCFYPTLYFRNCSIVT